MKEISQRRRQADCVLDSGLRGRGRSLVIGLKFNTLLRNSVEGPGWHTSLAGIGRNPRIFKHQDMGSSY